MRQAKRRGIILDIDETIAHGSPTWIRHGLHELGRTDLDPVRLAEEHVHVSRVPVFIETPLAKMKVVTRLNKEAFNPENYHDMAPFHDAVSGVSAFTAQVLPVLGYLTGRPEAVRSTTLAWLAKHGFPDAPLVMRPNDFGRAHVPAWKALILEKTYPMVAGIVDDDIELAASLGQKYGGVHYLIRHTEDTQGPSFPCPGWGEVVSTGRKIERRIRAGRR